MAKPLPTRPAVGRITPARLVGRDLVVVWAVTMAFFFTFGMTLAVLPLYVTRVLGGGSVAVGVVFAAYAVAAVVTRPTIGHLGARFGAAPVLGGGCVLAAVGLAAHLVATSTLLMVIARMAVGVGQAAVFVASTTLALDLAPPERRGESASYVLVGLQVGLGTGPLLGEAVLERASFDAVWLIGVVGCAGGALLTFTLLRHLGSSGPSTPRAGGLLDRRGLRPGILVALGISGFAAFLAFVPLYGRQLGATHTAPAFLLLSGTVAVVRGLGARLPDRLGPRTGGSLSLGMIALGLAGMAAASTPLMLYLATVVLGAGSALLFPSLVLLAISGVDTTERVRVMATYTLFIDIANAAAPVTLGILVSLWGYGVAFAAASAIAFAGALLTLSWASSGP